MAQPWGSGRRPEPHHQTAEPGRTVRGLLAGSDSGVPVFISPDHNFKAVQQDACKDLPFAKMGKLRVEACVALCALRCATEGAGAQVAARCVQVRILVVADALHA